MISFIKIVLVFVSTICIQATDFSPVSVVGVEGLPCVFHRNYMYYDLQYLSSKDGIEISNIGPNGEYTLLVNFCKLKP